MDGDPVKTRRSPWGRRPHGDGPTGASGEIARQRARIAEIRTNAGIVVAEVSLVASFLGAKTIDLNDDTK